MNVARCPSCGFEQGHNHLCPFRESGVEAWRELANASAVAARDRAELAWFRRREEYVRKLSQAVAQARRPFTVANDRAAMVLNLVAPAHDDLLDFEGDDLRPE